MGKYSTKERIEEKIEEVQTYLQQLSEIKPRDFKSYVHNFEKKAACERYAEKIPEALVDLAVLIIKHKKLPSPKDDKNSFVILAENNIISQELSKKLQDAKGMRNIIAHDYGKIDDEIIFEAIDTELEKDCNEFLGNIKKEVK